MNGGRVEEHVDRSEPDDDEAADTVNVCCYDPSEAEAFANKKSSHHNIQMSIEAEVENVDKAVFLMVTVEERLNIRRQMNCCVHVHTLVVVCKRRELRQISFALLLCMF